MFLLMIKKNISKTFARFCIFLSLGFCIGNVHLYFSMDSIVKTLIFYAPFSVASSKKKIIFRKKKGHLISIFEFCQIGFFLFGIHKLLFFDQYSCFELVFILMLCLFLFVQTYLFYAMIYVYFKSFLLNFCIYMIHSCTLLRYSCSFKDPYWILYGLTPHIGLWLKFQDYKKGVIAFSVREISFEVIYWILSMIVLIFLIKRKQPVFFKFDTIKIGA